MKFDKKSLKKLEKITAVSLASVALVLPMAMGSGQTEVHASHYYPIPMQKVYHNDDANMDLTELLNQGLVNKKGYWVGPAYLAWAYKHNLIDETGLPCGDISLHGIHKLYEKHLAREHGVKPARRHVNVHRHRVIRRHKSHRNNAKKQLIRKINRAKAQLRKDKRALKHSHRKSAKRNYRKAINKLNKSIKKMNRQLR